MRIITRSIISLCLMALAQTSLADDTEIFEAKSDAVPPNVLFVIDNSGSMASPVPGDTLGRDRMQVLKDTFKTMLSSMDPEMEVGLSRYSGGGSNTRGISFPVTALSENATTVLNKNLISSVTLPAGVTVVDDADHDAMYDLDDDNAPNPSTATLTVKDYISELVDSWTSSGHTPITGQLLEAHLYFKGAESKYGHDSPSRDWSAHPSTYSGYAFRKTVTKPGTAKCPSLTDCTATFTPGTCVLENSPTSFWHTNVSACIANGTCAGTCTVNSVPPTTGKVICSSDTDATCGVNCNLVPNADPNEPRYYCDGPTETKWYTCSQYYSCEAPDVTSTEYYADKKYVSPVTEECQNNYVVLLSDGEPQGHPSTMDSHKSHIKTELGLGTCDPVPGADPSQNTLADGECGPELVSHMASSDYADGTINADLDGDQSIKTYTIGYGLAANSPGENYLKLLANNGSGEYYSADSAATLTEAFNKLLEDIQSKGDSSLTSPAYQVNNNNLLAHNSEIFIPVASHNTSTPRWSGNLKKFKLVNGVIKDSSSADAINAEGALMSDASDLWSSTTNTVGGAAGLLDPISRNLLTDIGSTLEPLASNNASVTAAMLAVPTANYRHLVLDYIRGFVIDVRSAEACTNANSNNIVNNGQCEARQAMGDILHSKPVVVSYDKDDSSKSMVYVGTNEGFLHGISVDTGEEKFAYMPSELLSNIDILFRNSEIDDHPYGVDGEITVVRHDDNKDGKIKASDGDHIYLYFGLRRGGYHYYALDVTDPSSPSLLWKKGNSSGGSYAEMGQTWGKPAISKLRYTDASGNPVQKRVMVVGGGYDPALDEESRLLRPQSAGGQELHTQGRAIYVLDASNGNIIAHFRHATDARLQYSITSDIRLMDMNGDDYLDRLYFSDTGGNLWRVDLFADSSSPFSLSPQLTHLARLGETTYGADLDSRKFYHEPDTAVFQHAGGPMLTVSVGSGYHAHPLNKDIQDSLYVVKDPYVFDVPPANFTTITRANLQDVGGSSTSGTYQGWYYNLPNSGEKVLSSPITFLNKVLFTSFTPDVGSSSTNSCERTSTHQTRFYAMDLLTGSAVLDLNGNGGKAISKVVPYRYIAGTPHIGFREPTCDSDGNCQQHIDLKVGLANPVISSADILSPAATASESLDIESFLPRTFWIDKD